MKVLRWVCHCEKHKGSGIHYHCGFKLREMRKWISVKERTQKSIIFHLNLLILNTTISATTGMHVMKSMMWPTVKTTQTFRRQNLKPYYVPLQLQQSQQLIRATKSSWLLSFKCHLFHKRAQNPVIYKFASSCWSKAKGKQENMAQFLFSRTKRIH